MTTMVERGTDMHESLRADDAKVEAGQVRAHMSDPLWRYLIGERRPNGHFSIRSNITPYADAREYREGAFDEWFRERTTIVCPASIRKGDVFTDEVVRIIVGPGIDPDEIRERCLRGELRILNRGPSVAPTAEVVGDVCPRQRHRNDVEQRSADQAMGQEKRRRERERCTKALEERERLRVATDPTERVRRVRMPMALRALADQLDGAFAGLPVWARRRLAGSCRRLADVVRAANETDVSWFAYNAARTVIGWIHMASLTGSAMPFADSDAADVVGWVEAALQTAERSVESCSRSTERRT
jgi:hypothetical protein